MSTDLTPNNFDHVGEYVRLFTPSQTIKPANMRIVDALPSPKDLPDGTVYGTYSVTLPNKTKIIPFQYLKDIQGILDTETGFTRQFLKTFPRRKVRYEEYMCYRETRPPLFVKPSLLDNAVYIDIEKAYPSVYQYLGWMTDYKRGSYWGVGDRLTYPYPMSWKSGRSYVVTGARHVQFGRHVYKGIVQVKPYASPFSNPPLVAGVYDVLAMCARFAVHSMRAVYWNTDGGIMPEKAAEIFIPFLESVGLKGRIKYSGNACVLSSGYWKVGPHETQRWLQNARSGIHSGDYIPVDKDQAEWIYKQFRRIAERKM